MSGNRILMVEDDLGVAGTLEGYFKQQGYQVDHVIQGKEALDEDQISHQLETPIRLVRQILFELMEARIITPVQRESEKNPAYQPATNPNSLTIKNVIDALDQRGTDDIPVAKTEEVQTLSECLKKLGDELEKSPWNRALVNI